MQMSVPDILITIALNCFTAGRKLSNELFLDNSSYSFLSKSVLDEINYYCLFLVLF